MPGNNPATTKDNNDSPTNILESPSIETVAKLIKENKAKKLIIMAGAGISTSAGIPDFRSPGTGLYDNLQKYDLPYPEAIFDVGYFQEKPEPFFELAKELYPGKFFPTLTHYFIKLLHQREILLRCFTQNIDTLERLAGLSDDILVEAHGSFATSKCLNCRKTADPKWMREAVLDGTIPRCQHCHNNGIVKPCITFFGESLPKTFFQRIPDFKECDLLIVLGTSLQVQPFASLIDSVPETTPRLLINREAVGVYGISGYGFDFEGKYQNYRRDAFFAGACDEGVRLLAKLCGWESELDQLYAEGHKQLTEKYKVVPSALLVPENLVAAEPTKSVEEVDSLAALLEQATISSTKDENQDDKQADIEIKLNQVTRDEIVNSENSVSTSVKEEQDAIVVQVQGVTSEQSSTNDKVNVTISTNSSNNITTNNTTTTTSSVASSKDAAL
ncbi:6194_t:CDS:2 [Ambispora gerdemannii]|uniref:6194_t:CDS:1 n=1 Tax=Ambispora gerdemannii TaxID=144530 RepID=A0A9N8ZBE2_9GLOM|nr:6194_t:CDS:2 [Ambispora gerdemannii]